MLAGGQSLVPLLSMRLAAPRCSSTSTGCPGLDRSWPDDDGVRVGALARHADVLASDRRTPGAAAGRRWPWPTSRTPTIRNRGTTVGSLVHADAAAEMPVVLRAARRLGRGRRSGGRRTIAADELFVGPLESSVEHDEIALSAFFPALAAGAGVAFEEIARRHGDYALCGVAALVDGETRRRSATCR